MVKLIVYHGTTTQNAQNILKENFIIPDKKNYDNWLGRGAYFFLEDIFAFKWCVHEYKKIYNDDFTIEKAPMMSIIEAKLEYDENRILDLTYFKGQCLFDETYKGMLKSQKYCEEFEKYPKNIVCIVIDYMFEILSFGRIYDAVKQIYRLYRSNYSGIINESERGFPQYQVCVKNNEIIKDRVIFDYVGNINNYIEQWNKLINVKPFYDVNIVQENVVTNEVIYYDDNNSIIY